MSDVKVSVIVPVYNVEKYLRECLESLVNQTLKEIEIICINDGSEDSSLEILNEYASKDSRLKIVTQENSGLSIARNNGIKLAKGDYIGFVDSDEISFYDNLINFKYQNIFERLFSIKKQFSCGKFYNTVTICGIKIKIKNQAIPMINSSKNKNCAIVIPCYKEKMTEDEKASLIQGAKVLNKYDICLIAPNELNLEAYLSILNKYSNKVLIKRFSDDYFKSVNAYNRLMLNIDFYKSFSNYNFMLIYQLDAWVFRDELEYWCEQGYDYLGAPWFEGYCACNENSKFLKYCGNGGFSLRNIAKICNLLSKKHCVVKKLSTIYRENRDKNFILNILKYPIVVLSWIFQKERFIPVWKTSDSNEDGLITNTARKIYPDFKVATAEETIPFAFECNPDVLYEMSDKQLPFGCHAYKKYNWDFWKKFINVREVLSEQ